MLPRKGQAGHRIGLRNVEYLILDAARKLPMSTRGCRVMDFIYVYEFINAVSFGGSAMDQIENNCRVFWLSQSSTNSPSGSKASSITLKKS